MATKTTNLSPSFDTQINSYTSTTNYDTLTNGLIGRATYNDEIARVLMKFDYTTLGAVNSITSATLYMYLYNDGTTQTINLQAHRVLVDWTSSQATWLVRKTGINWNTSGCGGSDTDFYATALGSVAQAVGYTGWVALEISATEFLKMVKGTYPNYGISLRQDYEGVGEDKYYYFLGGTYPPYLRVVYTPLDSGEPVSVSPFFNFFKNFENPWMEQGGLWQPNKKGLVTI